MGCGAAQPDSMMPSTAGLPHHARQTRPPDTRHGPVAANSPLRAPQVRYLTASALVIYFRVSKLAYFKEAMVRYLPTAVARAW